ncbi:hypothetical protein ABEB36_005703, partial [Hypothenemus hampei]
VTKDTNSPSFTELLYTAEKTHFFHSFLCRNRKKGGKGRGRGQKQGSFMSSPD